MENQLDDEPVLLFGRWFTRQELLDVIYITGMFPTLSRNELAKTICEGLEWTAENGKYKIDGCIKLLGKLHEDKKIELPGLRTTQPLTKEQVIPGANTVEEETIQGSVSAFAPITLQSVRSKEDIRLWNEYVERYHYLGYKRPFGAHQRYFIWSGNKPERRLGCLLFSASAWALAERDSWIGWSKEDRSQRLKLIVNNTRFLIFPWVRIKNLASKSLALAAKQVPFDWKERYGFEPVLLETFVDEERYRGTCYQAANWISLGLTIGEGRMGRHTQHLSLKRIYMYPLRADFRSQLLVVPRMEDGELRLLATQRGGDV